VAIEEDSAQEANLLNRENPLFTDIDPIAEVEGVPHEQKYDRNENIV
jgi:hypothetical protein